MTPTDTAASAAASTSGAPAALPLFYRKPAALQTEIHAGISLKRKPDFGFARETNAIPLTAAEFFAAQRHYPIVFTRDTPAVPLAIVGLRDGHNLFVDRAGQWRANTYVPAYVRRYPFLFAEDSGKGQLTLCVDEASGLIETGDENPLFDTGGQAGAVTRNALDFCLSYQQNHNATTEFSRALVEAGLLVDRDARVNLRAENFVLFRGFRMIDEEIFNRLSDETFLAWRRRGWVALVHAHLMSLGSWDNLASAALAEQG